MALQLPTLLTLLLLLITFLSTSSAAPSPSSDCSTAVLSLADCLSYVTAGSTTKKPEGNCCSGLAKVLKTNTPCLCEAFKNSAQFGVSLNITKAMTLPQACKLSNTPSISNCGISNVGSPAISPIVAPPISGSPTTSIGAHDLAPAPAPSAASYALSVPAAWLALGLVIASSLF